MGNWVSHSIAEHFCICRNIKFSKIDGPHNDWGHTARNYGLEHASQDWVVMTGDDNYYTPDFVSEFLKNSRGNNFIFCNMVHNEAHYKHYQELKAELADWIFVENFITLFPGGVRHIDKILYVHN